MHETCTRTSMNVQAVVAAARVYSRGAFVLITSCDEQVQPQHTVSVEVSFKWLPVRGRQVKIAYRRAVLYTNAGSKWEWHTGDNSEWRTGEYAAYVDAFVLASQHCAHVTLGAGSLTNCPLESAMQQPETGWLYDVALVAGLVR